MAVTTLHQHPESATTWAKEVDACRQYASELEDALRHTRNVLTAILEGDMLSSAPKDNYELHSAACGLLGLLERNLSVLDQQPRTDLSIMLSALQRRIAAFE